MALFVKSKSPKRLDYKEKKILSKFEVYGHVYKEKYMLQLLAIVPRNVKELELLLL